MSLREVLRFFRSSPLALSSETIVLAVGFATSALALTILNAFSSLTYPGVVKLSHGTVSEEAKNGGSFPISYQRFERFRYAQAQMAVYSVPIVTDTVTVAAVSFEENERNLGRPIILSAQTAQRLFGDARNALDRTINLKGRRTRWWELRLRNFADCSVTAQRHGPQPASVVPLRLALPPEQLQKDPMMWKRLDAFYVVVQSKFGSPSALTQQIAATLPPVGTYDTQLHVSPGLTTDPLRGANLRGKMRLGLPLPAIFTLISSLNFVLLLLARTIRLADEAQLKRALGATGLRLLVEFSVGPGALMCLAVLLAGAFVVGGMMGIGSLPGFIGQMGQQSSEVALQAFAAGGLIARCAFSSAPRLRCSQADSGSGSPIAGRGG